MKTMERFTWPDGYQSAAIFTFDVDGSCAQQLREGNILGNNSSGDYGPRVGLPRILDLFDKYDLKAVFFVPAWIAERFPDRIKDAHDRGHEIGAHGYVHENLLALTEDQEREVHDKSVRVLTEIVGTAPRMFRSPGAPATPRTIRFLLERGFDSQSCSMRQYYPFRVQLDGKEVEMVDLPASWPMADSQYFWGGSHRSGTGSTYFLPLSAPNEVIDYWIAEFEGTHEIGGLFQTLCHPASIGRVSRLRMLEQFLRRIKATPGVWIATPRQMVDWVMAQTAMKGGK
jgi:peptidoglycan/xylan/chitin deacetylase (PgdA/CDA1 family)